MLRCFKTGQKEEPFFENGSSLLKELITTFNGRQEIPIRCFTAKELIDATNNFADEVGQTDFKFVIYEGSMNERLVLVKKLKYDERDYPTPKESIRDIAITSQMSQLKNVLKLSGCCLEFKYPALVYEYVKFETLYNRLHHNDNVLSWRSRMQIAIGIANVILYLHTSFQTPIIFRNLTPSHVVIDQHGVAKLIDFSLSISLPLGESKVADEVKGTYGFMDPEYTASGLLTQKSDVYSFGVMLIVLVTGHEYTFITYLKGRGLEIVDYVKDHIERDQSSQIVDPKIVNQGFHQLQVQAILDLGMRCTHKRGEDRPEMIDVARELRDIEKSVNR